MLTHRYAGRHTGSRPESSHSPAARLLVAPLAAAVLVALGGTALATNRSVSHRSSRAAELAKTSGAAKAEAQTSPSSWRTRGLKVAKSATLRSPERRKRKPAPAPTEPGPVPTPPAPTATIAPPPAPTATIAPPPAPTATIAPPPTTNAGNIPYASYPTITGPRFTPTVNKTGRQIISAPGVYSGWNVTNGNIDIQSNGGLVILEDFIVDARGTTAPGPVWVRNGYTSKVEIRYGRVIGAGNVGSTAVVTGVNGYVHNIDLSNSEDGFRPFTGSKIEANWVHNLYAGVGSHNDTLQLIGTEHDVEITQNRFDAPYRSQNAAVFIKADVGNIDRINVHNNYMFGGGYSVYVYDAAFKTTNVALNYNVFVRGSCTYSQLVTLGPGLTSKVGNTWDDGALIWG